MPEMSDLYQFIQIGAGMSYFALFWGVIGGDGVFIPYGMLTRWGIPLYE